MEAFKSRNGTRPLKRWLLSIHEEIADLAIVDLAGSSYFAR
jgi:hypothetical protein